MITANAFRGKRYAVYGLARTGKAVIDALVASGADVVAWDDKPAAREGCAVPLVDLHDANLVNLDALVVSPGVPLRTHPLAQRAASAGVKIIGDIELFAQARAELPPHRVVGITGTNGKSTTTALIHHLLQSAGVNARLGGNIGLPIMAQEPLPDDSPLWTMDTVLLTPHVGGAGGAGAATHASMFADNLRRWFAGQPLDKVAIAKT